MPQNIALLTTPPWLKTKPRETDRPTPGAPTFALYTLGCKVNQYDSHQIARTLVARGFRRVEFRESADLYVIDTCTVTAEADKKSRKAAARARRNNPDAVVAVTGCAATRSATQFERAAPGALILGNAQKWELPDKAIDALLSQTDWAARYALYREQSGSEPMPSPTRERAVLKIQDGCNHKCAFCIIPSVRGASVVKPREVLIQEARAFVREGAREITITGVSMGDWGKAVGGRQKAGQNPQAPLVRAGALWAGGVLPGRNTALCDLIRAVATIEGLERVRVSSLDPADVDEEFLQTVADTPKVCPHIHLALQAGGNATLRRMRRRYTSELFLKWARRWREIRPDGGLTTDIIVGFPGESEEDFHESLRVAREARFSAIHVFPYSPREGTHAATLEDHISPAVQDRRVDELLALARDLSEQFAGQFIGQSVPILVESIKDSYAEGMTENYLKARIRDVPDGTQVGDVVSFSPQIWHDGVLGD
ncbi:MAG TPA: MiaB/RimO family radical SAM methylthiotransferase [Abditibacteriaceae bacterium]|jgi:threonylcarbamoyladenosine tRNA methylthiotransferase MtaB